jgi:hypothetical protein
MFFTITSTGEAKLIKSARRRAVSFLVDVAAPAAITVALGEATIGPARLWTNSTASAGSPPVETTTY